MNEPMECPNCKEIELERISGPDEHETVEYECSHCGHYQHMSEPDYDPTPWCEVCNSMTEKNCTCPKPFYASNH